MISTPRVASTSSIQASSRTEAAIVRCRRAVREQAPADRDGLREVDADPPHAPVVDAPELGLEALAERDDGAVRVPPQEAPDLAVERQRRGAPATGPAAPVPKRSANG